LDPRRRHTAEHWRRATRGGPYRATAWDARHEAREIAEMIRSGSADKRVILTPRGARVVTSRAVPVGSRETVDLRRRELLTALDALLADDWRRTGTTYRPL